MIFRKTRPTAFFYTIHLHLTPFVSAVAIGIESSDSRIFEPIDTLYFRFKSGMYDGSNLSRKSLIEENKLQISYLSPFSKYRLVFEGEFFLIIDSV